MKRALLAIGAAACATSAVILGTAGAGDEILLPHAKHAAAGVECIACHEAIWDAKALGGDFIPNEAKCLECHKQKKEAGQCGFCHADVRFAGPWPKREPKLKLDHAAHLERTREQCAQCHPRLSEPGRPAPASGGHDACLKCHAHAQQYADAACTACHLDLTRAPTSLLSHEGDFLRRHGTLGSAACGACHDQNFCLDMTRCETECCRR